MNKYALNLSPDYCKDWTVTHAIRELLQNALDDKSTFQYGFEDNTLVITSVGVELPLKTLMLGNTSKAFDGTAVGGFGEGYKIALLVLARAGYDVTVKNGSKLWTPELEYCEAYQSEMLYIKEDICLHNEDLSFIIKGITDEEQEQIVESCLYLQEDIGKVYKGHTGRILLDSVGKVYVGGLFVTNSSLQYSYDFNPDVLALNRDRQSVGTFDLVWETSRLWNFIANTTDLAQMLYNNCPDVEYVPNLSDTALRTACYDVYQKEYTGSPIAEDTHEQKSMTDSGINNVVVTGNRAFTRAVKESSEYNNLAFDSTPKDTPLSLLEDLYDDTLGYSTGEDYSDVPDRLKEIIELMV